jgi:hypothetical protein
MKMIYTILLMAGILFSCKGRDYKYKIYGKKVMVMERQVDWQETNVNEELVDVIAYTDIIHGQTKDSVWYYNSNGSKMTILSPYKIYKTK